MGDRLPDESIDVTHSLMIPAYGDSEYLRIAVRSALTQTSHDWSLDIFDDGPPDTGVAEWANGLDARVRYQRNEDRLGINRNFARCLAEATGDLVTILGADDRLGPTYVEVMRAAATANPVVAWVHPGVTVIGVDGLPTTPLADRIKARMQRGHLGDVGGEELAVSLLRGNWMYFPSVAFRRSIVAPYSFTEGLDIALDLDLYLRLLMDNHRALVISTPCFDYRRHAASLSSQERAGFRFREEAMYFEAIAAQLGAFGWARAARAARQHLMSRLHAAALLPASVTGRTSPASLWRHVVGTSHSPLGSLDVTVRDQQ